MEISSPERVRANPGSYQAGFGGRLTPSIARGRNGGLHRLSPTLSRPSWGLRNGAQSDSPFDGYSPGGENDLSPEAAWGLDTVLRARPVRRMSFRPFPDGFTAFTPWSSSQTWSGKSERFEEPPEGMAGCRVTGSRRRCLQVSDALASGNALHIRALGHAWGL